MSKVVHIPQSPFPMQPIVIDENGHARFQANRLVLYLLDKGGLDMNDLARAAHYEEWSDEEQQHFAQLIGYSVSGYGGLSYVSDKAYSKAVHASNKVVRHFRPDSQDDQVETKNEDT